MAIPILKEIPKGFILNPENVNELIPEDKDSVPDVTWTLARLETAFDQTWDALQVVRRKETTHIWLAGQVLYFIREKLKDEGKWMIWQRARHLNTTTVWEAIELYKRESNLIALLDLGPTEAKEKYGIYKKEPKEGTKFPNSDSAILAFTGDNSGSNGDDSSSNKNTSDDKITIRANDGEQRQAAKAKRNSPSKMMAKAVAQLDRITKLKLDDESKVLDLVFLAREKLDKIAFKAGAC